MKPRIEINKNPRAKQPYSVSYYSRKRIGKGKFELLFRCENLPTRANCITNIKSAASIFKSFIILTAGEVLVTDNTGKEPKIIQVKI